MVMRPKLKKMKENRGLVRTGEEAREGKGRARKGSERAREEVVSEEGLG